MRSGVQLRPWLVEGSSVEEACAQAAAAGFDAVELGYQFAEPLGADSVAKVLAANGLTLAALHTNLDWANASDGEVRKFAGGHRSRPPSGGCAFTPVLPCRSSCRSCSGRCR